MVATACRAPAAPVNPMVVGLGIVPVALAIPLVTAETEETIEEATEETTGTLERVDRVSEELAWAVTVVSTGVEAEEVTTGVVEAATVVGAAEVTVGATVGVATAEEEEMAAQISWVTSIAVSASAVEQPFKTQGVAAV